MHFSGLFLHMLEFVVPALSKWRQMGPGYAKNISLNVFLIVCIVYFQDLLTRHKLLSAEFLEQHYDRVSPHLIRKPVFNGVSPKVTSNFSCSKNLHQYRVYHKKMKVAKNHSSVSLNSTHFSTTFVQHIPVI